MLLIIGEVIFFPKGWKGDGDKPKIIKNMKEEMVKLSSNVVESVWG